MPPAAHTTAEVADALRVSVATVRRLIARGELRCVRVGVRCVRVTPEALSAYLERDQSQQGRDWWDGWRARLSAIRDAGSGERTSG